MVTEVRAPSPAYTPRRGRGTALILLASVCFGSSGTIAKPTMLAGLTPEQVASARIGLAALVLATVVAVFRPRLLRVRRAEWPLLIGYGLLGVAGVQLCYFVSVGRLPVGIAILLEFTSPVLIALWVRLGPWRPPAWLLLAILVLLATVLAYFFGTSALRHLPAPIASVLGLAEPVVTVATAWALLGETLAWVQAVGAAILLTGALIV